jgi:HEPN domain-containing protein
MPTLLFETDEQRFTRCYEHACGYHHRARVLVNQTRSPSLVFNVAAIAVECYLIALCALHGDMPMNHNYRSLLRSIEDHVEVSESMRQSIVSLDTVFGICAVDDYHHGTPDEHDRVRILALCDELDALIRIEQATLGEKLR